MADLLLGLQNYSFGSVEHPSIICWELGCCGIKKPPEAGFLTLDNGKMYEFGHQEDVARSFSHTG